MIKELSPAVKRFIETRIAFIDSEDFEGLYEEADTWLTDTAIEQLTNTLQYALNIDLMPTIETVFKRHVIENLNRFSSDGHDPEILMYSFLYAYMNTLLGLSYEEGAELAYQAFQEHPVKNIEIKYEPVTEDYMIRKKR